MNASAKLKVLDLFSGIGGFSLGLERTGGFETVAFCEIEEFPRRVLAKHWPEVPQYHDVRELTAEVLARDGITVDVITGGFPCQDISVAGKQAGIGEGTRSGLWSEIVRLVGELRPRFVIVENVANLLSGPSNKPGGWFGRILGDLAECGYNAEWRVFRGYEVGIPQTRTRVWLVAYPTRPSSTQILHQDTIHAFGFAAGLDGKGGGYANANYKNSRKSAVPLLGNTLWLKVSHRDGGGEDDRISSGVDRYKSIGNSVIPQIPELIGNAILQALRNEHP